MKSIKGRLKVDFLAVIFDEIERISFGTASSPHWNSDRDFLLFWQSLRAGFQSKDSPYTFIIVGTNPSAFERPTIFESDNPLFGNIEKRFMPMFDHKLVQEMVSSLGGIMGLEFDDHSIAALHTEFGGHPFLTRYACSYIAKVSPKRPLLIDRTLYRAGIDRYFIEAKQYVSSVVEMLSAYYKDEYEMLKYLAIDDNESFYNIANDYPVFLEHLIGYGLIKKGENGYFFNIGIARDYFEDAARPIKMLSNEERLSELNTKRNKIEIAARGMINKVFSIAYPKQHRINEILKLVPENRRAELIKLSFENIVSLENSPLYFNEIKQIISAKWDLFKNVVDIDKGDFEYHMGTINKYRNDAHAKSILDEDLERVRVSFREIEKIFSSFL